MPTLSDYDIKCKAVKVNKATNSIFEVLKDLNSGQRIKTMKAVAAQFGLVASISITTEMGD